MFKHGPFDSMVLSGRGKPGDSWNFFMRFSQWCPDGVQLPKECIFLPFLSRHLNQLQETSYLSRIQEKTIQEMKVNSLRCILCCSLKWRGILLDKNVRNACEVD